MSGPQPYPRSTTRMRVLEALADADTPLDADALARRTGFSTSYIREVLIRPTRARWVTATRVPRGSGGGLKVFYSITDLGRQVLAGGPSEEG